jgi:hypothetical protein
MTFSTGELVGLDPSSFAERTGHHHRARRLEEAPAQVAVTTLPMEWWRRT